MTPFLLSFLCEPLTKEPLQTARYHLVYQPLRAVLSHLPFGMILFYARLMAVLRFVPGIGLFLEKSGFCMQGDVPRCDGESVWAQLKRRFKNTTLNTFDWYGSHQYQHHKTDEEMRALVTALLPDKAKVRNMEKYFLRPQAIGCALRVSR